ncbi:MAG: hypothetical protein J5556_03505 [Deltaproteobacteria bacterium]|nr:hypothetical protein [Deltaproteobacteria bacterium]
MAQTPREETIEGLKAAIAELESADGLERFVEGHGLQSRFFAFRWNEPGLEIDFRLPYARVLADEDEQRLDAARIGGACRMAILLMVVMGEGRLLLEGESTVSVRAGESGEGYSIQDADGEVLDSGGDWEPLITRLKVALPDSAAAIRIIWP